MPTQFEETLEIDYPANLGHPRPETAERDKPKKPSNAQRWQEMADKGDVQGLLREIPNAFGAGFSMDLLCRHLHDAIDRLARDNPAAFATLLQADILAGVGKMVIRAQYLLDRGMRQQKTEMVIWSDESGFEKLAERVMALNAEVTKLFQVNASTQLTMERARKLKLANDKAEVKKNRPRRPRRQRMSPQAHPMTSNSRIGGNLP